MNSSLTAALEEMRRENDVIKTDNTQLRSNIDAMKDEIGHLNTLLDSKNCEIVQLRTENQQLKVSQWSGITSHSYTTPNIHTLRT